MTSPQDPIHGTNTRDTAPETGYKCVLHSVKLYISVDNSSPVTHTLQFESPITRSTIFSFFPTDPSNVGNILKARLPSTSILTSQFPHLYKMHQGHF